jgi:hypothetical protein
MLIPPFGFSEGSFDYSDHARLVPSQNDGKPVPFSATRDGTFLSNPVAGIQVFNRAGMPAMLEVKAKTNRGLRQGS